MDEGLRRDLLRRAHEDQQARQAIERFFSHDGRVIGQSPEERAAIEHLGRVDADNIAWLKNLIDQQGWPSRRTVGEEGADAAWLLAQHADQDPAFQRLCLQLMRQATDGDVDATQVAYLTDRVQLAHGLPQIYGTQVEHVDGEWRPRHLADPDTVDDRRAGVGLGPIADYLHSFQTGAYRRREEDP